MLLAYLLWGLVTTGPFIIHSQYLYPAFVHQILVISYHRTGEKAEHKLTPHPVEKGHKGHSLLIDMRQQKHL